MDQAVDGRGGGHGIFEYGLPLGEWEVAGNHQAAPLIAVGRELELLSQVELTLGAQRILIEQLAGAEQDPASPTGSVPGPAYTPDASCRFRDCQKAARSLYGQGTLPPEECARRQPPVPAAERGRSSQKVFLQGKPGLVQPSRRSVLPPRALCAEKE